MRRLYFFVKNFKYDFLSALGAIAAPFITFYFGFDKKTELAVLAISLVTFLYIVIHLRLRDKDFYFIPLTRAKDKYDWIGAGTFGYSRTDKCFQLTNAEAGYIYSKCLIWSDYRLKFEFKIVERCLGVIVRATNLSNYAMLQIEQSGIRPHVRINGGWHVWESKDVNLIFPKVISLDRWYKCQLSCDKGSIGIEIINDNKEKIFDRQWNLPVGSAIFVFKKDGNDTTPLNIPFPINLEYGSVGFRNWGSEQALVRNVLIEKI